jgi:hypothetical protein
MYARCSINPDDPKCSELPFSLPTISIGVLVSLHDSLIRHAEYVLSGTAIAFGSGKDLVMAGLSGYCSFYSWHRSTLSGSYSAAFAIRALLRSGCASTSGVGQHLADRCLIRRMDQKAFTQLAFSLCRLLREDVIEVALRAFELP